MNSNNKLCKITLGLIISMSMISFVGCQSKTAKASTTAQGSVKGNNRKSDPQAMKKLYVDALKALVTAGTIKQVQSDKVLVVLTKNISKSGTQVKAKNNEQSKQQGNAKNNGRKNPLSELVTSGVINQVQSDAIMQKTRGNFKRTQN